jgi:hypothetical protein
MKTISALVAAVIATTVASTSSAGISGSGSPQVSGISGSGSELLVIGPVEIIEAATSSAIVLGQRIHTSEALAIGETVAVFGVVRPDGSIAASAVQSRGLYVAGATPIFLAGTVQKAEPTIGRVVVNGVAVDLTSAMSHGAFAPSIGSKLAISGTQPVNRGVILVSGISGSGSPQVSGISGSGSPRVNGISGSGSPQVSGISGSGSPKVNGISGSGSPKVNGISGSGSPKVNGISGSGSP